MNNNNVFYQLRELDENISIKSDLLNGNFNANLKKPIILNEGDELIINKAIIDTRTLETDKIILQNDVNINISLSYYLLNDSILTDSGKFDANGGALWTTGDIDYELYVLGVPIGSSNPVKVYEFTDVSFDNPDVSGDPGKYKPFDIVYSYVDVNNIPMTVSVSVTLFEAVDKKTYF